MAVSTLAGCVAPAPPRISDSYAQEVPGIDPAQLAQAASTSLATLYPPPNTTWILDASAAGTQFGSGLTSALSQAGFAVADPASAVHLESARIHRLRYRVSGFDAQALVQFDIDDRQITQLYATDATGRVSAAAAPTVRDK